MQMLRPIKSFYIRSLPAHCINGSNLQTADNTIGTISFLVMPVPREKILSLPYWENSEFSIQTAGSVWNVVALLFVCIIYCSQYKED